MQEPSDCFVSFIFWFVLWRKTEEMTHLAGQTYGSSVDLVSYKPSVRPVHVPLVCLSESEASEVSTPTWCQVL